MLYLFDANPPLLLCGKVWYCLYYEIVRSLGSFVHSCKHFLLLMKMQRYCALCKQRRKTSRDSIFWKSLRGSPWGLTSQALLNETWNCEFLCVLSLDNPDNSLVSGRWSSVVSTVNFECELYVELLRSGVHPLLPKCEVWTESEAWVFPLDSLCSSHQTRVSWGPAASLSPLPSLKS